MGETNDSRRGKLLSPSEVAGELRISPKAVRRLCREGELPAIQIGKRWYVPERDLDRALTPNVSREE